VYGWCDTLRGRWQMVYTYMALPTPYTYPASRPKWNRCLPSTPATMATNSVCSTRVSLRFVHRRNVKTSCSAPDAALYVTISCYRVYNVPAQVYAVHGIQGGYRRAFRESSYAKFILNINWLTMFQVKFSL